MPEKFRIIRYFYDTTKDSNHDVIVNPTNLTTESEVTAMHICELLTEVYELGTTKTPTSWYKFGFEVDDGKWIVKS